MKRLATALAFAVVLGATEPGCPCTAAGALIGLIVGSVSDDPYPDANDRIRAHVQRGAEIGFQIDAALVYAFLESGCARRDAPCDGRMLARLDVAGAEASPRTAVVVGPTGLSLACRF